MNRIRAWTGVVILAVAALVLLFGADASRVEQDRLGRFRNLGKAFYENPTTQPQAVDEFKKALDLAPNSAREHVNYGFAPNIPFGRPWNSSSERSMREVASRSAGSPEIRCQSAAVFSPMALFTPWESCLAWSRATLPGKGKLSNSLRQSKPCPLSWRARSSRRG